MNSKTEQKDDYMPGDPALRLIGRDEKPARKHARQAPKPVLGEKAIKGLMQTRMVELEDAVNEYKELTRIDEILSRV